MPEIPVGRITFNIKGRDINVQHDLKIPIPDDLNSDIWTDFGKDLYREGGATKERALIRAKVEEMLAKAEFTEELDKLLRWLDGEDA